MKQFLIYILFCASARTFGVSAGPNPTQEIFGTLAQLNIPKSVSDVCAKVTQYWLNELNTTNWLEVDAWAVQMADAWGKLPEGILRGHVNAMGDFDECVGIQAAIQVQGESNISLTGKYCTTSLVPTTKFMNVSLGSELGKPLASKSTVSIPELMNHISHHFEGGISLNPSLAVCLPSQCTQEDVQILITELFAVAHFDDYFSPIVTSCSVPDTPKLGTAEIAMISVFGLIGFLLFVGTIVEYRQNTLHPRQEQSTAIQILVSFSLISNTRKLLSTAADRSSSLSCLHGLRFLTLCWVVLGHTWFSMTMNPVWNSIDARMLHDVGLPMAAIDNFSVSVDTFFTIAGLLVAFNLLRTLEKSQRKINIPMLYFHRYIRLTPTIAAVVGFTATLWPFLGSGPNWFIVDIMAGFCRKSWWINLLYLNNLSEVMESGPFGKGNAQCLGHAWYVATDMQYYVLSPFLLYVIWKWKRIGMALLTLLTILSSLVPLFMTYLDGMLPTAIQRTGFREYELNGYFRPWLRFGPYLVGIWTGYILHRMNSSPFKLKRKILIPGWLIATCSALAVVFGPYSYWDRNKQLDNFDGVYAGFHRNVWAICIGWIVVCCTKGHGGFVNSILSWKPFLPLSRLTFSMYLISWPLQMIFVLRMRQPIVYDAYSMVNIFFAHLVMSILVGAVFTLAIESPFISLEKILFKSRGDPKGEIKMKLQQQQQQNSKSNLIDMPNMKTHL